MLHIEKGGKEQIPGEIEAYNPLIPQGVGADRDHDARDRRAEPPNGGVDEARRDRGEHLSADRLRRRSKPSPPSTDDRTSDDGKTSSVHWVRFRLTQAQVAAFRAASGTVILGATHPQYGHMAVIPADVREELAKDFD